MYYRNERRGRLQGGPRKGAENPGAGKTPEGGPYKTADYVKPDGPTQPTNRSLGMPRIKTNMAEKGV
jgi:hypothetical protein